ncbi:MAG: outer membrane protein assembly factor BamE [Herminiimonas sp.]|nr:outer membrane protein assembly factor BamE [Herminiimonas sp.]
MRPAAVSAVATLLLTLGACGTVPVNIGESEQQVIAKLGNPTHRYQDGNDRLLEYMQGPWGQATYMARIGPDGKLISYEQALAADKFAKIKIGESRKEDVLRTIGAPSETSYLSLPKLEVWSYPYRESNVWDSVMHVHFDDAGTVRQMMNAPDRRRTPGMGGFMGRM